MKIGLLLFSDNTANHCGHHDGQYNSYRDYNKYFSLMHDFVNLWRSVYKSVDIS